MWLCFGRDQRSIIVPRAAKQLAGNLPEIFKTEVSPYPSWILVVHTISIGSKHALVLALCCKLVSYVLLQLYIRLFFTPVGTRLDLIFCPL